MQGPRAPFAIIYLSIRRRDALLSLCLPSYIPPRHTPRVPGLRSLRFARYCLWRLAGISARCRNLPIPGRLLCELDRQPFVFRGLRGQSRYTERRWDQTETRTQCVNRPPWATVNGFWFTAGRPRPGVNSTCPAYIWRLMVPAIIVPPRYGSRVYKPLTSRYGNASRA